VKFELKPLNAETWPLVCDWWMKAGFAPVPLDILPDNTSYIGYIDDIPTMSVCLYLTNSKVAYLENFIANPDSDVNSRKELVKWGIEQLEKVAKDAGKIYFWAYPTSKALVRYYQRRLGFKTLQEGITSMARKI